MRYEFVDGFPLRMMAGAGKNHDRVTKNIRRSLDDQIDEGPCETFSADVTIRPTPDQRRYPDLSVDCDTDEGETHTATHVRLALEVLSPTTRAFDLQRKVVEYQRMDSLEYILLIDSTRLDVRLWHRADDRTWDYTEFTSMDETADLPAVGASLPISAIYRRVEFPPTEGRSLPTEGRSLSPA